MTTQKNRMPARVASPKTVHAYSRAGIEPTIAEMLSEPIVRTLMARDAVSDATIARVIAEARAQRAECCAA
jgi:hypothetical protein